MSLKEEGHPCELPGLSQGIIGKAMMVQGERLGWGCGQLGEAKLGEDRSPHQGHGGGWMERCSGRERPGVRSGACEAWMSGRNMEA